MELLRPPIVTAATLTLPVAPLTENAVQVYWDGVYQHKDNWAISGTTLTFSTAPGTGVKVEAVVGSHGRLRVGIFRILRLPHLVLGELLQQWR